MRTRVPTPWSMSWLTCAFRLLSLSLSRKLDEPSICNYTMSFEVPIPCLLIPNSSPVVIEEVKKEARGGGGGGGGGPWRFLGNLLSRGEGRRRGAAGSCDAAGGDDGQCVDTTTGDATTKAMQKKIRELEKELRECKHRPDKK